MKFCTACGSPRSADAKFCSNCGAALAVAPESAPPDTVVEAPQPVVETPGSADSKECRRCGFWTTHGELCRSCVDADPGHQPAPAAADEADASHARTSLIKIVAGVMFGVLGLIVGGAALSGAAGGSGGGCAASFNGLDQSLVKYDYYDSFTACSSLEDWTAAHRAARAAASKQMTLMMTCGDTSLPASIRLSQVCRDWNVQAYGD